MKSFTYLLLIIILTSCSKIEEKIEVTIKNKELNYCLNLDSMFVYRYAKQFPNDKTRMASTNLLKLTISNKTSKNYLFLIKDFDLVENKNVILNLYEDGKKINLGNLYINRADQGCEKNTQILTCMDYKHNRMINTIDLLKKEGFKNLHKSESHDFPSQSFIVHSNESILSLHKLKLPFVVEDNIEGLFDPKLFYFEKGKKYEFSVTYKLKKGLENSLPIEIQKNLKENKIEIFSGEIESNRVPIKNIFS